MKKIMYWHVKLFQHGHTAPLAGGGGGAVFCRMLLHEGYSLVKPYFNPGSEYTMELLTDPAGLESKTVRTYGVDSMVCTPIYEEEPKSAFITAVEPLMKYLAESHNPHTSVIVNSTEAELVTGEMSHCTDAFLKD